MATISKKTTIKRLIAKELPGWELISEETHLSDSVPPLRSDARGATAEQVQRKYSRSIPVKRAGNGSLVRVKSSTTQDAKRGTKTAFVHDGKILGLQG